MKLKRAQVLVAVPSLTAALALIPAAAAQAKPDFSPKAGTYSVDTTTLTLKGPGTNIKGKNIKGVAVFSFTKVSIPAGATIDAAGSRPLAITATGSFSLAGRIDGSGFSQTEATFFTGKAGAGGPGGGTGSANDASAGAGKGGGKPGSSEDSGAGGGGFGGRGAAGGSENGTGGAGGVAYGNLNRALTGGSGGAGGSGASDDATGGGGGGGAIELSAASLRITATGAVLANGGAGGVGGNGASGGGSGGGILLHAAKLDVLGNVSANGGDGGSGECCSDGGGGGGGRIAYQYVKLTAAGSPKVAGGKSGENSSGPSENFPSPEVSGATGVFTKLQAGSGVTGGTSSVTSSSAHLHASIHPRGHSATYRFQYGTSKRYGRTVPGRPAKAGSGKGTVKVSKALGKLKPGTTYHYRVVVYSLGFTVVGADRTFKTTATSPTFTG